MTAAPTENWIDAEIPAKLGFFAEWGRWRYKVVRGGRGKGASRTIATVLAARGAEVALRWFCGRETQKSTKFSSMQLIVDAINRLGVADKYTVVESDKLIRGNQIWPDGRRTIFTFEGIRDLGVDDIKSLEDFDGVWLAEAHEISKISWNKITPTFRKEGSEIWVDYNPQFEEDFIHTWCADPPANAKIVHLTYKDNPWFPQVLRVDMEHMRITDPIEYEHVWLGKAKNSAVGAVYGQEMAKAYDEKRIVLDPGIGIDRTVPIDTFWDLGHGDPMAIWFSQMLNNWVNLLDYYENDGEGIEHYAAVLRSKGYTLGTCWLPWDGCNARLHHKLTGTALRSPEQIMRDLGFKVRIAPDIGVDQGISAVRSIFPQLRFNEPKCRDGIHCLRRYQWGEAKSPKNAGGDSKLVNTKPIHDQYSHGADALRTLAVAAKEPKALVKKPPQGPRPMVGSVWS